METEFLYERLRTPIGVKVELVSGSEQRTGRVWRLMAAQVYAENGRDSYRAIDHLSCGAPVLEGEATRISLTHTDHLLAVATLPPTPECDLSEFGERTALGIDAERRDREQVLRVRPRFMNEREQSMVPAEDVEANVVAWTCKEALWKAMLMPGLDFRDAITIDRLPEPDGELGEATVNTGTRTYTFRLYTFIYAHCIVTIAITPRTATYKKAC